MTQSVTDAMEAAAIPTAIAIVNALDQFRQDLGANPTQIPLTVGPAFVKFMATVELQGPALATNEWSAIQSQAGSQFASWKAALQAKQAALAQAASNASATTPPSGTAA